MGDVVGWSFQSRAATVMISSGILTDPMPGLGGRAAAEPKSLETLCQSGLWIQAVGTLAHTGPQGASWGSERRGVGC